MEVSNAVCWGEHVDIRRSHPFPHELVLEGPGGVDDAVVGLDVGEEASVVEAGVYRAVEAVEAGVVQVKLLAG